MGHSLDVLGQFHVAAQSPGTRSSSFLFLASGPPRSLPVRTCSSNLRIGSSTPLDVYGHRSTPHWSKHHRIITFLGVTFGSETPCHNAFARSLPTLRPAIAHFHRLSRGGHSSPGALYTSAIVPHPRMLKRSIVAHRFALVPSEPLLCPRAAAPSRSFENDCHRCASRKTRPHVQRLYNTISLPHTTP